MSRQPPIVLRLPPALLDRANPWFDLLVCDRSLPAALATTFAGRFAFKNDERRFVRELAARKNNYWIFRCDQRAFCGDFVVVDMSSPAPRRRRVAVIDLKLGAPLRVGGGGAGVQFRNAARAVVALASARHSAVVAPDAPFELLSGDRHAVLGALGVGGANASRGVAS